LNVRKGLIRLWVILSIPWWAVTGWIAFDANRNSEAWSKSRYVSLAQYDKLIGEDGNYRPGTENKQKRIDVEVKFAIKRWIEEDDKYEFYVFYMLPVPLIFGFVLLGGVWVFQGFRGKE
jgi:hypothetical protein